MPTKISLTKVNLILTLFFLISFSSFSQNGIELRAQGEGAYYNGDYKKAGELYEAAGLANAIKADDYYNAACSWSLAGERDRSLLLLDSAFLYGFGDLDHVASDTDLSIIKSTKRYSELIQREREFYADSVITMKGLIKYLSSDREVLYFSNKRFVNEYSGWVELDLGRFKLKEMLKETEQYGYAITQDSLLDFSKKSLFLDDCFGNITLQNFKLNQLTVNSGQKQSERYQGGQFAEHNLQLNRLDLRNLKIDIQGYSFFRLNEVKTSTSTIKGTDLYSVLFKNSELELNKVYWEETWSGKSTIMIRLDFELGTTDKPLEDFAIESCTITSTDQFPSVIPLQVNTKIFEISQSVFKNQLTFLLSKAEKLFLSENEFEKAVDLSKMSVSEKNSYSPFDQFKNGFGVIAPERGWNKVKEKILITGEEDEIGNRAAIDLLIFTYKKMFENYRAMGDLNSANATYSDFKDILLKRDHLEFKEKRTFKLWINYQIGLLLKIYTENGTSPAKAIVMSFYIILAFSFLYLFFPSEWDTVSKSKLLKQYKVLVQNNEFGYFRPFLNLLHGFFLSWLNAFVLSINAFVTLGFGSIPTTGIGRYICIIQGFIGWFLLSIFTVALLNQVLP